MPASGKKAAKRAARLVYNSDDEAAEDEDLDEDEEAPPPTRAKKSIKKSQPTPAAQEDDATLSDLEADSDDELEEGTLTDLRAVERRMRTSGRVLGNWKELGGSAGMFVISFWTLAYSLNTR